MKIILNHDEIKTKFGIPKDMPIQVVQSYKPRTPKKRVGRAKGATKANGYKAPQI